MQSNVEVLKIQVDTLRKELSKKESQLSKAIREGQVEQGLRYYVYFCLVDGKMAYIGKGTGDRWKHTISGSSSCRELNRDLFAGKTLTVYRTHDRMSEEEAYTQEEEFIFSFGLFDNLYNRVLPSEDTRFSDWCMVLGDDETERGDLAIMRKCFNFLAEVKFNEA